ncbi:hypothetical protein ATN84_12185 [Paramesorhizobium deserti]|uniref:Uncharacterized protein n=2 Tax=Paramesorhizobium deserti TaxID=1494590 RepID=A0A135HV49_9HYPH|nr:hypothetical protein ATN84_12185 [Paramesorhizobium deserti]
MTTWLGAMLFIVGILFLAKAAIDRGRLSDPHVGPRAGRTLEPPRRGLRFLGLAANWPGIVFTAAGALLMLAGALIE